MPGTARDPHSCMEAGSACVLVSGCRCGRAQRPLRRAPRVPARHRAAAARQACTRCWRCRWSRRLRARARWARRPRRRRRARAADARWRARRACRCGAGPRRAGYLSASAAAHQHRRPCTPRQHQRARARAAAKPHTGNPEGCLPTSARAAPRRGRRTARWRRRWRRACRRRCMRPHSAARWRGQRMRGRCCCWPPRRCSAWPASRRAAGARGAAARPCMGTHEEMHELCTKWSPARHLQLRSLPCCGSTRYFCAALRCGRGSGRAWHRACAPWRPGTAPADARAGRLRQDGLWWLPLRRARTDALRKLLLLLSLGAALAGLEARAPSLARTPQTRSRP